MGVIINLLKKFLGNKFEKAINDFIKSDALAMLFSGVDLPTESFV